MCVCVCVCVCVILNETSLYSSVPLGFPSSLALFDYQVTLWQFWSSLLLCFLLLQSLFKSEAALLYTLPVNLIVKGKGICLAPNIYIILTFSSGVHSDFSSLFQLIGKLITRNSRLHLWETHRELWLLWRRSKHKRKKNGVTGMVALLVALCNCKEWHKSVPWKTRDALACSNECQKSNRGYQQIGPLCKV